MKQRELQGCVQCGICRKKIGECGLPLFYRLRVEQYILNLPAIERQSGLEKMLGSATLAFHMGTDEDMATKIDTKDLSACAKCASEVGILIMDLLGQKEPQDKEEDREN